MEMILTQPSGGNVPAFLAKLWKMVNNPEIGQLFLTFLFSNLTSIHSASNLLVRRRELLPDQEPVPVLQLHATLLLQALQHGLLHTPAQHV